MEEIKTLSNSIVKDGVQAIILVGHEEDPFNQNYVLIRDNNDRGCKDGKRMYGLPGGAIEKERGEEPKDALLRELYEEINFEPDLYNNFSFENLKEFGCYQKLRLNGFMNDNHLFVLMLDYFSLYKDQTNDPMEVSEVRIFNLLEIINLISHELVHEGSIRLIFNYLNGKTSGSLNEPATFSCVKI